ncbi:RagB/SusD family nutrient uptake outer membrane protein [Spirosoma endbachense]|uniref:RagB/SusD family nutrient uptake outer membrane protein n=1 Tax=Spirosoma endbachense TaxID=2666025 RepID=A0A6P1VMN2_9BACT|nr:RagB/SusD family nutrient uptake outer membrane protein [Spirosoma endbachense]QHV94541.1 RagB/SusD family nutrient uptake outer membrane protein [Spirosoma endbachense]
MLSITQSSRRSFYALIISLALSSCSSLLDPVPLGIIELNKLFTTRDGIIAAVNGSYAPLQALYRGPMQQLTDLASDDGWTWRNELDPDVYIIQANSTYNRDVWETHYLGICRANDVINNIENAADLTDPVLKKAVEGQAKFIRAYYYFNLVRLFGDVPLIVRQIKTRDDAEQPRAATKEIYAQIKKDLSDAETLLPANYSGSFGLEKGRPTAQSASALKALVHLELEEWDQVKIATEGIINKAALPVNYASNFNGTAENSPASFFEVQYGGVASATTSILGQSWSPTSAGGQAAMLPTDNTMNGTGGGLSSGNGIVQAFEPGDLRKTVSLASYDLINFLDVNRAKGSLLYVNKYYNTVDPRGQSTWNYPLIRLSEIILTRAEALNEIGFQADKEAFELLNLVRTKAGLKPLLSSDIGGQEEFRNAIRKERRTELAFEAKRYFDLNRWGILATTIQEQMNLSKRTFPAARSASHPITGKQYFLYPLPATEFINNARLGQQNPGYN